MIIRLLDKYRVNSSRIHLERLNREFATTIPPGSLVLDAAAGSQPYRHLFDHVRYEAADFEQVEKAYAPSTYVCDLTSIPVEDGRFDFIVFNQGLEHMPEPLDVLRELHRVMRPAGRILCTAPFFYEEHERPYDFFRYTQYAYKHMFPKAGFRIDSIDWVEGYLGTLAYQLETAARNLPRGIRWFIPRLAFAVFSLLLYRADLRKQMKAAGFPKNYVVTATKAGPE